VDEVKKRPMAKSGALDGFRGGLSASGSVSNGEGTVLGLDDNNVEERVRS
jgi:hypothetical protein